MNTLPADFNELTALLNSDAQARAEARTLANIARRAATLFTDGGYTAFQSEAYPELWSVFSPKGDFYSVRAASTVPGQEYLGDRCDCPCFAKRQTCKHLQAVLLSVEAAAEAASDAAQIAEYERRMEWENFSDSRFDC